MMTAPGVVGSAVAVGHHGAAEFGSGERGDGTGHAQFDGRVVEGADRLAELLEQRILRRSLSAVGVESAEAAEENLTAQAQLRVHPDDARGHLHLIGERIASREYGLERRSRGKESVQQRAL